MQKKKNPSAFIRNTYTILERHELSHIIAWNQQGNGFIIHDLPKFESQILPQYFKHQKYTSFVRQLNMYGFHKQKHPYSENYFLHETFQKGQSLSEIKRKPQRKKKSEEQLIQSKKMLNQEEPLQKIHSQSLQQINSDQIINPEGEREEEEAQEHESEHQRDQQVKILNENGIGNLCQKAILQNQILLKVHSFLMPLALDLKKRRLSILQSENNQSTPNMKAGCQTPQQSLNVLCEILKTEIMKLNSLIDSSN